MVTPKKNNMEAMKTEILEDEFPFSKGMIFRFFQGFHLENQNSQTSVPSILTLRYLHEKNYKLHCITA